MPCPVGDHQLSLLQRAEDAVDGAAVQPGAAAEFLRCAPAWLRAERLQDRYGPCNRLGAAVAYVVVHNMDKCLYCANGIVPQPGAFVKRTGAQTRLPDRSRSR